VRRSWASAFGAIDALNSLIQVPIFGFMKPFMGSSTATLFKLLGWGKDVDAKVAADVSPQ